MIDLYCERVGPGLSAEPVNTVTNLAFFVAAFAHAKAARDRQSLQLDIGLLVSLMIAIGAGSSLFHGFATVWARYLDELPILLFQLVFLWLYGRRIMRLPRWVVASMVAAFFGVIYLASQLPPLLNGSLAYAPAFVVLILLGAFHMFNAEQEPWMLLLAAGVFHVSLIFRTFDNAVCDQFPLGTHFLWHLCNGLVLYLVSRGYLLNHRAKEA